MKKKNILEGLYQNLSCFSTTVKTIRRNLAGKKFEGEVYVLNKFISPGDVCFDIGAAYGRYAFHFSELAGKKGVVYCFEPGDYSFKVLTRVVWFHRLDNVIKVKKALSDRVLTATLEIPYKKKGKIGPSLARLNYDKSVDGFEQNLVAVTTLDKFVEENGVNRINFIKCDVEGAEFLVFKGGKHSIERFKPVVLCEIDEEFLKKNKVTPKEFFEFFYSLGYKSYIFKDNHFTEVNGRLEDHNYFFIPADSRFIKTL